MAEVLQPKVDALWVLHRLLASAPPRVFVLFSSVSAVAPKLATGLLDYAAANRFLDLFAQYQHSHGHSYYRSVQWTRWRQTGLARDVRESGAAGTALDPDQCLEALRRIESAAELGPVVCVAAAGEPALAADALERRAVVHGTRPLATAASVAEAAGGFDVVRQAVRAIVARELEIEEGKLDDEAAFEDLGIDSIVLVGVITQLEQWLGKKVDPSALIKCNSIGAVARHLAVAHALPSADPRREPVDAPAVAPLPASRVAAAVPMSAGKSSFPVAVIGIACRFPGAADKESFWWNLVAGVDSVSTIPPSRWDAQSLYAPRHQDGEDGEPVGWIHRRGRESEPGSVRPGAGGGGGPRPAHPTLHRDESGRCP